ncbi:MAG: hypothetical protein II336_07930 [Loktanella sp.]|nr:hypothetical protein [Loktanella sp.]
MKQITLGLPPEIIDALQHLGGRNDAEIRQIVCDALRRDFERRALNARARKNKPPPQCGDGDVMQLA